jgi:hypothetical protein
LNSIRNIQSCSDELSEETKNLENLRKKSILGMHNAAILRNAQRYGPKFARTEAYGTMCEQGVIPKLKGSGAGIGMGSTSKFGVPMDSRSKIGLGFMSKIGTASISSPSPGRSPSPVRTKHGASFSSFSSIAKRVRRKKKREKKEANRIRREAEERGLVLEY